MTCYGRVGETPFLAPDLEHPMLKLAMIAVPASTPTIAARVLATGDAA